VAVLAGVQPAVEDPRPGGLHLLLHGIDVLHDRLQDVRRRRISFRLIDGQQVLLHRVLR
jgi:hypothetical protein